MNEIVLAVLSGVPYTIAITVAALLIGAIVAVPLTAARRSASAPVRGVARAVIDVGRGIPPIVWLFIIFFGIGNQYISLSPFEAGAIGLGLISGAYLAEIYRGGLSAVSTGQYEAASALGMAPATAMTRVVAPQAFRVALPSASTYAIGLLKDSSVVSAIGVTDIVFRATAESRASGAGFAPFLVAGIVYILVGTPLAFAARTLDSRLRQKVAR